jgi:ubiquinol-cytochrome c reductase cytochrome b subunit
MARFVTRGVAGYTPERLEELRKVAWAVSAEAGLPAQAAADQEARAEIEEGRALIASGEAECARCHTIGSFSDGDVGPDLTGWASRQWLIGMIRDPSHESYYGADNDRMPSFGVEQILTEAQIGLIADWLRGDWYDPQRTVVH